MQHYWVLLLWYESRCLVLKGPTYASNLLLKIGLLPWAKLIGLIELIMLVSLVFFPSYVITGRPAPAKELTDEYNVLEACLWKAISLNKGCYKGQETIARLVTYDGVKQKLWGIHLDGPADPGSAITVNGKRVGKLTSYSAGSREPKHVGLGYIKKQACTAGLEVVIGDAVGTLVDVPFLIQQPEMDVLLKS